VIVISTTKLALPFALLNASQGIPEFRLLAVPWATHIGRTTETRMYNLLAQRPHEKSTAFAKATDIWTMALSPCWRISDGGEIHLVPNPHAFCVGWLFISAEKRRWLCMK
jgi:hypothetical protein